LKVCLLQADTFMYLCKIDLYCPAAPEPMETEDKLALTETVEPEAATEAVEPKAAEAAIESIAEVLEEPAATEPATETVQDPSAE
jgi:hypothetical protein